MNMKLLSILRRSAPAALALVLLAGCDRVSSTQQEEHTAHPIGHAECAACGMTVGNQPAPRGQVVHHDGTRAYLCSISDLIHYAGVPSRHGRIVATFVEVMDDGSDPAELATESLPWARAAEASYVMGVARPRIMGPPVLTYGAEDLAMEAAARFGGAAVSWEELQRGLHRQDQGR